MTYTVPETLYYCQATKSAKTAEETVCCLGYDPSSADLTVLPSHGIYQVNQAEPDFDQELYSVGEAVYTISGDYADQTWEKISKPLEEAKSSAISELKAKAKVASEEASNGFPALALAASSSKTASSRDASVQTVLDNVNDILVQLVADIAAVNNATTVDQINAIVNP